MRRAYAGIIILILIAAAGALVASSGTADGAIRLLPPSSEHLAGTDTMGRELIGRLGYGVLISFSVALPVAVLSILFGVVIAFAFTLALPERPFLMLSDTMKSLPPVVLALFLNALSGPGIAKLILALTVGNIPNIVRLSYSRVVVLRNEGPALAARAMGIGRAVVFIRHILPFLMPYLCAEAVSIFSASVLTEASLSYLGCGVPPMIPSLGSILAEGRSVMLSAPWMIAFPAVILAILGLSLELIATAFSESDPASHRSR